MAALTLTEKLRAGHVRRWHIVALSREQTVADHMHRVGVIAEEILTLLGLFSWDNNLTLNVMRWCAIHDRHEVKIGDIPTPGKVLMRMQQSEGRDVEYDASCALDEEFGELSQCMGPAGECSLGGLVVKLADLLEAMNYLGIFGCGLHAMQVWGGLRDDCTRAVSQLIQHPGVVRDRPRSDRDREAGQLFGLVDKLREGRQWS